MPRAGVVVIAVAGAGASAPVATQWRALALVLALVMLLATASCALAGVSSDSLSSAGLAFRGAAQVPGAISDEAFNKRLAALGQLIEMQRDVGAGDELAVPQFRQSEAQTRRVCSSCPAGQREVCDAVYLEQSMAGGPGYYYCCSGNFLLFGVVGCICEDGSECRHTDDSAALAPPDGGGASQDSPGPTPVSSPSPPASDDADPTPAEMTLSPAPTATPLLAPPASDDADPAPAEMTLPPAPAPTPTPTPVPMSTDSPSNAGSSDEIGSSGGGDDLESIGRRALQFTNEFRAQQGKSPLGWNDGMYANALAWAQRMANTGNFKHQDLSDPIVPFPSGIRFSGENIAYFSRADDPARKCIDLFIGSPGHRRNMLSNHDLCAVGFAQNSRGQWYCSQEFGRIFRTP